MNAPDCSVTNILQLANYQGTVTSAIKINGVVDNLFDLSGMDSADGKLYYDDGVEAATIAGKLKIIDSTGATGYINVWSASS